MIYVDPIEMTEDIFLKMYENGVWNPYVRLHQLYDEYQKWRESPGTSDAEPETASFVNQCCDGEECTTFDLKTEQEDALEFLENLVSRFSTQVSNFPIIIRIERED